MEKVKKRVEIQEEDDDSNPFSDDAGLDVQEADDLNNEGVGATFGAQRGAAAAHACVDTLGVQVIAKIKNLV